MCSYGLRRSWPDTNNTYQMSKIYESLEVCKQEYVEKANRHEQFLQKFGCKPNDIPEELFSFLIDNVHESVWKHVGILPVYIIATSQGPLLDKYENDFSEQMKKFDKKIKDLQRKEADLKRKLDYNTRKIQELESKFSVPHEFFYKAKRTAYTKELISKSSDFQDMPDLAQLFTEIKVMNKKLESLNEDIATVKAKLSKYGKLPPNIQEAEIVMRETETRYKTDAIKMKSIMEDTQSNLLDS